ncbi:TAXI family TRAP transporter solute-binding subunit [Rhodoblastus sp.]|uniref:TAXI family TRAP transporter solute-binding subunit n=1 Tax=Rhodoblastus sp. TaxID=1962975 RepID=UPI0026330539|nr:TAXI family TRAP transporter solute-binding subunit [Rhodoblastus sp.]
MAAVAGLVAVAILSLYFYERPTILKIAVPHGGEYQKLFVILNQEFVHGHEEIRLRIVQTSDEAAASKAISEGHVDLAVVRSDLPMPTNASTALILAHDSVVIVAPPGKNFTNFSDLKGHTIGVITTESSGDANRRLLATIESQYSIEPKDIKVIDLTANDLARFLRNRQIDALFVFGPVDSPQISGPVTTVSDSGGASGAPTFVPILEASALAERTPGLDASQILRGAFGGSPSRPPENVATIGATVRLVARNDLDNSIVGEVTRLILANRAVAATTVPIANHIEAPSTDKGKVLPTHPGAAAFLDGEEETFFDKYSDMIYIGAMVGSVIVSGLATLASRMAVSGHARFDQLLETALTMLKSSREAESLEALAKLENQIDDILTQSLAVTAKPKLDNHQLAALTLAVQQARLAIADRRIELGARPSPQRPA